MADSANLTNLKAAYAAWHDTKGGSTETWLDLMADDITIKSMDENTPGLAFAKDCCSKDEAVAYFASILEHWDMVHWTPEVYVDDGEKIAMFGHCAWRFKANGKTVECRAANLVRFNDAGKISEFTEVFDSARAAQAAMA